MTLLRKLRVGTCLGVAALVWVACSEPHPETATSADEFAAKRAVMKKALVEAGQGSLRRGNRSGPLALAEGDSSGLSADLVYQHLDRRDPFRSFKYDNSALPESQIGPLADYELSQLSVVAVVWDTDKARALISDPGGRAFVLHKGSQVGKNRGRIMAITDNLVRVRETYVDFEGHRSTKDVEMRIRGNQEG
ncbi:MAG: pilus assembly protein PilP [Myxococcota bacterium]